MIFFRRLPRSPSVCSEKNSIDKRRLFCDNKTLSTFTHHSSDKSFSESHLALQAKASYHEYFDNPGILRTSFRMIDDL
jgi:hypothetical protein